MSPRGLKNERKTPGNGRKKMTAYIKFYAGSVTPRAQIRVSQIVLPASPLQFPVLLRPGCSLQDSTRLHDEKLSRCSHRDVAIARARGRWVDPDEKAVKRKMVNEKSY